MDPIKFDEDGQPAIRGYNESRRLDRSISEFIGLIKGVLMAGLTTEREVHEVAKWILKNRETAKLWPVSIIIDRIDAALADGIVDDRECRDLHEIFERLVGDPFGFSPRPEPLTPEQSEIITSSNAATRLPLTEPAPAIMFENRVFVFTGKFLYGTRDRCIEAITNLGAIWDKGVTRRTDYLVIGAIGSADWAQSAFGRKIEKAVEMSEKHHELAIIAEEHWIAHIDPRLARSTGE